MNLSHVLVDALFINQEHTGYNFSRSITSFIFTGKINYTCRNTGTVTFLRQVDIFMQNEDDIFMQNEDRKKSRLSLPNDLRSFEF